MLTICTGVAARRTRCRMRVDGGGVGSAIAASLAAAGVRALTLYDSHADAAHALALRLLQHYPLLDISLMQRDPQGHDLVGMPV